VKVMLLTGPRRFELVERPLPVPGPGEVRVKVLATGLCGSDRRIYRGEYSHVPFPLVMGHEFCGLVDEVGEGVTGLTPGGLVAVNPPIYCGRCEYCRRNQENYCTSVQSYGVQQPGGLAQYVVVRAGNLYPADGVDPDLLNMAEPLACALHGLGRAALAPGEKVIVFGAGPIGLFTAQLALLRGAGAVLVVDRNPGKRAVAQQLGAEAASEPAALPAEWRAGADVVVEATGATPLAVAATRLLKRGGRLVLLGVYDKESALPLDPWLVYREELSVFGSYAQRYEIAQAVELMQGGRLNLAPLVTHRFPLAEAGRALALWEQPGEKIKIVIHPAE
jgi:2-desacetyl-2-hydroxyethyl bacteriochlorophyllide A dehydrogenase